TETHEVHPDTGAHGHPHAGDHVGIPGDQDHVRTLALVGGLDHVGDEEGVDRLLGSSLTPLDQLAGAQLHALDHTESALIPVRAGVRDAVIPVLALDRLVHQTVGYVV